ncbi:MAG: Holliday junction resolvase RuvX [Rikenella sp.]|nr:Holliday junction resolvase RuvX [Rikenella sp.]
MGRIVAIDYGRKRVGLATTDPLQLIATALDTVPAHEAVDYLQRYAAANEVERFVVGEPRQMNGEPSEAQRYILPFVNRLRKAVPSVPVVFFDERFTSVLAHRAIIEGGVKKRTRREDKGLVDRVSAVIILQSYLESVAAPLDRG